MLLVKYKKYIVAMFGILNQTWSILMLECKATECLEWHLKKQALIKIRMISSKI